MSSNRNIVKNAGFLYIRMFLIMGATLYSSRVVLNALGVSDYGLYNIIGGIVAMMAFINSAMSSATQRYLSFDIGIGDTERLKKTFSVTLTVHLFIAVAIIALGETIGLWYVNHKMVFPVERTYAVNIVYQFSLFTLFFNIVQVPYNALILARERMNVYAYVSILEALLKLAVAFLLLWFGYDKLILFSGLSFAVAVIVRIIYQSYCRRNFKESKYTFEYDTKYFKELVAYSGWNLFGTLSLVAKNQGVNMILNLFYGTVVNAAYAIAMQVQAAVVQFVSSFQMAINPQIIQSYAADNREKTVNLMFLGAKLSYVLMFVIVAPLILNTEYLLEIWLGKVPNNTIVFIRLVLVSILIDAISGPFMTGIIATGKIKKYNVTIGILNLTIVPLSYLLLNLGCTAPAVFLLSVIFSIVSLCFRIKFVLNIFSFSFLMLVNRLFIRLLPLTLFLCILEYYLFNKRCQSLSFVILSTVSLFALVVVISFITVLNKKERNNFVFFVKSKFVK